MTLATCAKDLKLYDWPSITLCGIYETSDDCMCIKSISWCNDGTCLVAVRSKEDPILIATPVGGENNLESEVTIRGISASVCCFSNTSNTSIAFGGVDGDVYIYDLKKNRKINEYQKIPSTVNFLEFAHEDTCLAAGCNSGQIVLYNSNPQPCATYVVPYSYSLSALEFSKTMPNMLSAASKEGIITVWNTERGMSVLTGRHHSAMITDLAFFEDCVTTVGADCKFINYDLRTGEYNACYNLNSALSGLAYLPNSFEVAISTCDGQLRSYDRRYMTSPINTVIAFNTWIKKICFAPCNINQSIQNELSVPVVRNVETPMVTNILPASGDFNPHYSTSRSTIVSTRAAAPNATKSVVDNGYLHELLPPSASQLVMKDKTTFDELNSFSKFVDDSLEQNRHHMEEKMLSHFYQLRIEMSKQFIELNEKINKSWAGFLQHLKCSEERQPSTKSSVQTFKHAVSEVRSTSRHKNSKK